MSSIVRSAFCLLRHNPELAGAEKVALASPFVFPNSSLANNDHSIYHIILNASYPSCIMTPNVFLLAADNSASLLPLLREDPSLASSQDEHGYSLVHAAASYNHLDLLRTLINELHVDVNIKDEDDETALFVVETTDAAKVLVEELAIDIQHRGTDGLTATEKIEADQEFPDVAQYLRSKDTGVAGDSALRMDPADVIASAPDGMKVTVGTMDQEQDVPQEIDQEFRRRIEEFAQRDDINTPQAQAELRQLVEDAVVEQSIGDERSVRPRQD